jgi:hypothetical protein
MTVGRALDISKCIDIFTYVDMRRAMLRPFKRTKQPAIEFCDRCAMVCDAACRRNAIVNRARDRALLLGMRWS